MCLYWCIFLNLSLLIDMLKPSIKGNGGNCRKRLITLALQNPSFVCLHNSFYYYNPMFFEDGHLLLTFCLFIIYQSNNEYLSNGTIKDVFSTVMGKVWKLHQTCVFVQHTSWMSGMPILDRCMSNQQTGGNSHICIVFVSKKCFGPINKLLSCRLNSINTPTSIC